jgi:hypothetical protein
MNYTMLAWQLESGQFWRLLTSQCAWQDSTSLFLGSMLLYNVATAIERAFGSLKFAVSRCETPKALPETFPRASCSSAWHFPQC